METGRSETARRRRILVVDDEPDVCELLRRILTDLGHEVEAVEDGGPAIESLEAGRYDLVILDLMMPVVEGWAVLDHLREREAPPPVIVLTARGDQESLARGLRESIAAYVMKPFEIAVLAQTVGRVLEEAEAPPRAGDRRRAARRAVVAEVVAYAASGLLLGRGTIVSLGPRGAHVLLDAPVEPGIRLALAVQTLDPRSPLRFEGVVRWCERREDRHAAGVEFVDLPPEAGRRLAELFAP